MDRNKMFERRERSLPIKWFDFVTYDPKYLETLPVDHPLRRSTTYSGVIPAETVEK